MTPRGGPLSENGKVLAMCILFPIFWPFIPVLLVCMACDKIRDAYWGWKYRRADRLEKRERRERNCAGGAAEREG